ncbi:hypothetical protein SAMN02910275_02453 [Butyrivibrio sp. INlla18]|uniref:hypothetical protein n=1 Tax=Butyrivibrio sp. INlla18 TaxID=1520806 RepID=UPI00088D2B35|nr:hypothetical protein [Butyrivibrio sp. INlla18]SDA73181.1 hypothetical protein SAMN02910275_02453 [Butyrivibrio sp. INlla18]
MASYLEVKKYIFQILGANDEEQITEDSDLYISVGYTSYNDEERKVIPNELLKKAYLKMKKQKCEGMLLYSDTRFEVATWVKWLRPDKEENIDDTVNGIKYSLGVASLEYIMMVCNQMCDTMGDKKDDPRAMRFMRRAAIYRGDVEGYFSRVFGIRTITIKSEKSKKLEQFNQYCSSFEYLYMYKTRYSIMRIGDVSDLFVRRISGRNRVRMLDEPPRRTVNQETMEFYAMALDADDPFTAYISFYHVLEYYFSEVYKRKIISEMKDKLTNPSFSYKNESKLYDLAKWIGKKMKNDEENGRGNELESLKYVLEEYVPISSLLMALDEWDEGLKERYASKNVSFSGNSKDIVAWKDNDGVYTNLANRIYSTRNALVHSKSELPEKQYKPRKHRMELLQELPLIQIIAELIIFKDGGAL